MLPSLEADKADPGDLTLDAMEEMALQLDRPPTAYEAALAEERLRWWAIRRPEAEATDQLMSYVRWRAAANRLQELVLAPHSGERLNS